MSGGALGGRGSRSVLSSAHISPLTELKRAGGTLWIDGGLIQARREGPRTRLAQKGGGQRGVIEIFSRAARRRVLRKIAKTKQVVFPSFCTLTYPDNFPVDPRDWKRDLDRFGKCLARRKCGAIWRIEHKERQTGDNAGQVAPHFHLLIWGQDADRLMTWLPEAWHRIAGAGDVRHLLWHFGALGNERCVQPVRSWRGVMSYTSKYVAKVDDDKIPDGCGRFWGVIGARFIPWSDEIDFTCPDRQVVQLFRYLRRYMQLPARQMVSMTVFINNPTRWELLLHSL